MLDVVLHGGEQPLFIARLLAPFIRILRLNVLLFDKPETTPPASCLLGDRAGHCAANLGAGRQPWTKGRSCISQGRAPKATRPRTASGACSV